MTPALQYSTCTCSRMHRITNKLNQQEKYNFLPCSLPAMPASLLKGTHKTQAFIYIHKEIMQYHGPSGWTMKYTNNCSRTHTFEIICDHCVDSTQLPL